MSNSIKIIIQSNGETKEIQIEPFKPSKNKLSCKDVLLPTWQYITQDEKKVVDNYLTVKYIHFDTIQNEIKDTLGATMCNQVLAAYLDHLGFSKTKRKSSTGNLINMWVKKDSALS